MVKKKTKKSAIGGGRPFAVVSLFQPHRGRGGPRKGISGSKFVFTGFAHRTRKRPRGEVPRWGFPCWKKRRHEKSLGQYLLPRNKGAG